MEKFRREFTAYSYRYRLGIVDRRLHSAGSPSLGLERAIGILVRPSDRLREQTAYDMADFITTNLPRELRAFWFPSPYVVCIASRHTDPNIRARDAISHHLGANGELFEGESSYCNTTIAPPFYTVNILEDNNGQRDGNGSGNGNSSGNFNPGRPNFAPL